MTVTPSKVLETLFEIRDQAHYSHLNTTSYARHKALNEFYDEILDLTDAFVETWQGKYGRITGIITCNAADSIDFDMFLITFGKFLNEDITSIIDEKIDTDLANIIADMKQLVNHTTYLLTLK